MEKQNQNRSRKFNRRERKEKVASKKCPFCGGNMKEKGASDSVGSLSFKCRNKKCGRRVWVRKSGSPPLIPIVPFVRPSRDYHN